jgi:Flp pilus assembly protein TadG
MITRRLIRRCRHLLRRFGYDRDGVSAVEFAILLPFMLTLYIGSIELGEGLAIDYKVTETARTVTDLASQYLTIDNATMQSILNASAQVMSPYSTSNIVVTVSQIQINANATTGTVSWSDSLNGTPRTTGSSVSLPTNLQKPSTQVYLIFGEVSYPYTPAVGYAISGTITMKQSMYFYPRLANSVACNSC